MPLTQLCVAVSAVYASCNSFIAFSFFLLSLVAWNNNNYVTVETGLDTIKDMKEKEHQEQLQGFTFNIAPAASFYYYLSYCFSRFFIHHLIKHNAAL